MTPANEGGFWNRKATKELLMRPLRERGIKTRDDRPAWQQLRDQVLRHRENRARYTPKAQRIAAACERVLGPGTMLLDAVEFEGPLPKYLFPFATALHQFHVAMGKRHGRAYTTMSAAVFDKPRTRAFFEMYTRLTRSQPTFLLKDLGVIQARGIRCHTASGEVERIRITDYGIGGLVSLTTELEARLTALRASRRRRGRTQDGAVEIGDPECVLLDLVAAKIVHVTFRRKTHTLTQNQAVLLRMLFWAHQEKKPYVTYEELEREWQKKQDSHRPAKQAGLVNNNFSQLVYALHKSLKQGLEIKITRRNRWIECHPGRGFGLNTTRYVWKTKKDRSSQRAAGLTKDLQKAFDRAPKRRGRTGQVMK